MPDDSGRSRPLIRALGALAVANALLLSLLATRYFAFTPTPSDALARWFPLTIVPGHFLLLSALPLLPCLLLAAWRPGRAVLALAVVLFGLLATTIWVDLRVFALYRFHLDGMVWRLLTSGFAHEILPFSAATLASAALVVAVVLGLEALLAWGIGRAVARGRPLFAGPLALVMISFGLAGQLLHVWADAWMVTPITRQARVLPWIRPLTAYAFLERLGWVADSNRPARPVPAAESALLYPREPVRCDRPADPTHVLLVVIEEWRFDELDPITTPHLWRFAAEQLRFGSHFSAGNSSRYGVFGLMYGLHGAYWDAALAEQRGPLLVREALRQGYRFGVFASASLEHPEFDRTVFADLRGRIPLRTEGARAVERDRAITERFLAFLETPDERPFFGFLFYDAPHSLDLPDDQRGPHLPAAQAVHHMELGPGSDPVPLLNRHRNASHFVDAQVGRVLDALEARGLLERTAVVVTGDHGEEFNDTGENYWGHNSNFSRYQIQVPLVARFPGRPGGEVSTLTSHVDVAPTLLQDVFGCRGPVERYSNGHSLFEPGARTHVVVSGRSAGLGIVEAERITLVERSGGVVVVDHELREIPGATPAKPLLAAVFRELGDFYASSPARSPGAVLHPVARSGFD